MIFQEKGRKAAHVLIDAVSASGDGYDDEAAAATNLAFQRLAEERLFDVRVEDDGDVSNVTIDLSDVLGASYVTLRWLIEALADARGVEVEDIIVELREFMDTPDPDRA